MRVGIALIMLFAGSQKAFGMFGGIGPQGFVTALRESQGFPEWLSTLAIVAELGGGAGLLLGFLTRLAAFGVLCTMGVAVWVTAHDGFNWIESQLPLQLAFLALGLMLTGPGKLGLDAVLFKRKRK